MTDFLTGSEMNEMQLEFSRILAAPEATDISIDYQIANSVSSPDPVYGTTTATSWTKKSIPGPVRAIQHIIHPRNVQVLDWGILEAGDCIFFISTDIDLTVIGEIENAIITAGNIKWIPVTRKLKAFYNYLLVRFGNGQIGQVIPCKLQQ